MPPEKKLYFRKVVARISLWKPAPFRHSSSGSNFSQRSCTIPTITLTIHLPGPDRKNIPGLWAPNSGLGGPKSPKPQQKKHPEPPTASLHPTRSPEGALGSDSQTRDSEASGFQKIAKGCSFILEALAMIPPYRRFQTPASDQICKTPEINPKRSPLPHSRSW